MPGYLDNPNIHRAVEGFYRALYSTLKASLLDTEFKPSLVFKVADQVREAEAQFAKVQNVILEPADVVLVEKTIILTPKGWASRPYRFNELHTSRIFAEPMLSSRPPSVLALRKE